MELEIYLWGEDVKRFIEDLICFFKSLAPDDEVKLEEKYNKLDKGWDRTVYFKAMDFYIPDYYDISYLKEDYGVDVNISIWIDIINREYDEKVSYISEIINWLMKRCDTDIDLDGNGTIPIFKRVNGRMYYRKDYEFFPFDLLDFDKEKALDLA